MCVDKKKEAIYTCTRVWAWVTEYMQVSVLVNTMLCFNNRFLHRFSLHTTDYSESALAQTLV